MMQKTLVVKDLGQYKREAGCNSVRVSMAKLAGKALQACLKPPHTDSSSYLTWETANIRAVCFCMISHRCVVRESVEVMLLHNFY